MRILLTNDDGIQAPGIAAIYDELRRMPQVSEVFVVAPLTVQSATGHGITYHEPLMIEATKVSETMSGIAVDGRPADCVKLAISQLWPERFGKDASGKPARPDLVISGINSGANCGINVIYSGTVAAAIEAAFLGVPSIALSMLRGRLNQRFEIAAEWSRAVLEKILPPKGQPAGASTPRAHECLSINFPLAEGDGPRSSYPAMPPVRVCPMNTHGLMDKYDRRTSPFGGTYYWAAGHGLDFHARDPGTDVALLLEGCITVTPLQYDLTDRASLERWAKVIG